MPIRTAEEIRARLDEGHAERAADVKDESFSETVAELGREHHRLSAHGLIPAADLDGILARLDAAADAAGISRTDADDLFAEELDAGPVSA